jgi:hypothetical protein
MEDKWSGILAMKCPNPTEWNGVWICCDVPTAFETWTEALVAVLLIRLLSWIPRCLVKHHIYELLAFADCLFKAMFQARELQSTK